jgi:membrane-associated phospholipid phosphatase
MPPRRFPVPRPAALVAGVCLALVALFLVLGVGVKLSESRLATPAGEPGWSDWIVGLDNDLTRQLFTHRGESPRLTSALRVVTQLGSIPAMAAVAVILAVLVWRKRDRRLALAVLLIPAVGGLAILLLKPVFDRDRPLADFRDVVASEKNESFPSGHSMGSLVGYGLAAYLLLLGVQHRRWRFAILTVVLLLVLAIGFSRVYLGAHYLSDVVAGYLIGACWLIAAVALLERSRRRKLIAAQQGDTPDRPA